MDHCPRATAALVTLRTSETTSSISQIPSERLQMAPIAAGNRNILLLSNATFARSDSQELTISALIFAHILTSDLSFAQSVARPSPASTIANATRVFILEKRSLSAGAPSRVTRIGVVDEGLLVPTPWAGILGRKLDVSASSLYLTRKPPRGRKPGWKSNSKRKSQLDWLRLSQW